LTSVKCALLRQNAFVGRTQSGSEGEFSLPIGSTGEGQDSE